MDPCAPSKNCTEAEENKSKNDGISDASSDVNMDKESAAVASNSHCTEGKLSKENDTVINDVEECKSLSTVNNSISITTTDIISTFPNTNEVTKIDESNQNSENKPTVHMVGGISEIVEIYKQTETANEVTQIDASNQNSDNTVHIVDIVSESVCPNNQPEMVEICKQTENISLETVVNNDISSEDALCSVPDNISVPVESKGPKLRDLKISRNCDLTKILEALCVINEKNVKAKRRARSELNTDRLLFNDETFTIIELLTLSSSERDKHLRKEAQKRNLCCPSTVPMTGIPFILNPVLAECVNKINLYRKQEHSIDQLEHIIGFDQINEVNFLIIDLLQMDTKDRGAYLLKLAEQRRILFRYCDLLYVVNPILNRYKVPFSLEKFISKVERFSATASTDKTTATISTDKNKIFTNSTLPNLFTDKTGVTLNCIQVGQKPLLQDLNLKRGDDISQVFKCLNVVASSSSESQNTTSQNRYDSIRLNGENLMLLDLLAMDNDEDRQQYILEMSVKRRLLTQQHKSQVLELNPAIISNNKRQLFNVEKCIGRYPQQQKASKLVTDEESNGKFRKHSTTENDCRNSGTTGGGSTTSRKERCDSEKTVTSVPLCKTLRSKSIDGGGVGGGSGVGRNIKNELHKANEKLQKKLLDKMQKCNLQNEQDQPSPSEKVRKRKGRGGRKDSTSLSLSNTPNDKPSTSRRQDPTYDTSVFETLESIAEKLAVLPMVEAFQLGSSSAYAAFLLKLDQKINDLALKVREKGLIYKPKPIAQSDRIRNNSGMVTAEKKILSYSDEVNRLYQDVTGSYSASMAPIKLQSNLSVFDVPENVKSIENFVTKLIKENAGEVYNGEIRINAFNAMQAYVPTGQNQNDALIRSIQLRQCAMHGDVVSTFVFHKRAEKAQSSTAATQPPSRNSLGFVIKIIERKHNREVLGHCSINKNHNYFSFFPNSKRVPRLKIYKKTLGNIVPNEQNLYLAQITEWVNDQPLATIIREIGDRSALATCNEAILIDHQLEIPAFSEEILNSLPSDEFVIPAIEYETREVLTKDCIFTIDPATARDLDDAMSCKQLSNGNYEIGVHISDVTYFISENCHLDNVIKEQATSIYLVDTVYHMLPRSLCMTCSLLPTEDKLTFSVFWEITKDCEILSTRFAKTIINSCVQLAYSHAQDMIEQPDREFSVDELPPIANGYTARDLSEIVNILHRLSVILRQKRFEKMSIKIDQPKISFDLDADTGEPVSFKGCKQMEANFLIEEFMLLANRSVAIQIFKQYPSISILRRHSPPKMSALETLVTKLNQYGMKLNIESSAAISESFFHIVNDSNQSEAFQCVLNDMLTKPMNRAEYVCTSIAEKNGNTNMLWHFALAVPMYTHFTSPIRRYPDILVHRLLAACFKYAPVPMRTTEELESMADRCNVQKYNAKCAGDSSTEMYFLRYVKLKETLIMRAVVTELPSNDFIEIMLMDTGYKIRVNFHDHKPKVIFDLENTIPVSGRIRFSDEPAIQMVVKVFTEITAEISVTDSNKLKARIIPNCK